MPEMLDTPSPNFDERKLPISIIVLHYTGMEDGISALRRLRDPEAKVSAHYMIGQDGGVARLVPEPKRAWHAGQSWLRGVSSKHQLESNRGGFSEGVTASRL